MGLPNNRSPNCTSPGAGEQTFRWTAPFAGRYVFDTNGSNYDTALYLLNGGCNGVQFACDDDDGIGTQSQIIENLFAGQTIIVVVDGFASREGNFILSINATEQGLCTDMVDNDNDGLIDCQDPDCSGEPICVMGEDCLDGFDNDGDGLTDCADPDCGGFPLCGPENCGDMFDNDGDGQIDCLDPDCAMAPNCAFERCDDFVDNDGDGQVDCADADCQGFPLCGPEQCADGFDNDGDGQIDCLDIDCQANPNCAPPEICDDLVDNDLDGSTDCADPDCQGFPLCGFEVCVDGFDNDGDGQTDCDDSDCLMDPMCIMVELNCTDGIDNDGDALTDCADPDCAMDPICQMNACVNVVLGSAIGPSVAVGNTSGGGNDTTPNCTGSIAADIGHLWTAPFSGTFTFDTNGSAFDSAIYVLDSDCNGPQLECSDTGPGDETVSVALNAGQTVVVVVDGFATSTGPYVLNITASEAGQCDDGLDNDSDGVRDCNDPDCASDPACFICPDQDIGSGFGTVSIGTTVGTGNQLTPTCTNFGNAEEITLSWTAPVAGRYTVDTNGTNFDSVLSVFDGTCGGPVLGCVDQVGPGGESLDVTLNAGQTMIVAVDGWANQSGTYQLNINPACPDANLGQAPSGTTVSDTTIARVDKQVGSCGGMAAPDFAYEWTPPIGGTYSLSTNGSGFDTVLYVQEAACGGTELACNDNDPNGGLTSQTTVNLLAGQTVVIVVDGAGANVSGNFNLSIIRL